MIFLLGLITLVGSATEQTVGYLEHHHWFFGVIVVGYIFHLHDKSLHARLNALDKRLDEIRKRLARDQWSPAVLLRHVILTSAER